MPKEVILDPSELLAAADAFDANDSDSHLDEPDDGMDAEAQKIATEHAAELERLISPRLRSDDPDFDQLASNRRADVYAHKKQLPAVGPDPVEGFIEPEGLETYLPAPQPASAFVVERKRGRRKI